jgi:hypothetical protein
VEAAREAVVARVEARYSEPITIATACIALGWPAVAMAQAPPPANAPPPRAAKPQIARAESPWHLGLEANTDFPLAISGRISLEMPARIRFATSFGVMPKAYVDVINAVVVAAGGYNQATADLIASALKNAFVFRTQLGWRFHPKWGFYLDAGYSLAALGGGATAAQIVEAVTEIPCPNCKGQEIPVKSMLHLFVAEIGYEFVFFRHFLLRTALGFAGTVAASTTVESKSPTFNKFVAGYLNDMYKSYGFTPTITIGAGGRFF